MRILPCTVGVLLIAAAPVRANQAENDVAMVKLANRSGCMACHSVLPPPRRADGLPPVAPAWRDVALKYRDDAGASERLTRTVMTGSDPQARHWAGRAGAVTMPPNAEAVGEADARLLVNWILVLVP
ncbi:MAG: cytochrome C552 [Rhizobacter sp.]|nr:cytochrome C552 [Rhizobacter sp.]